MACLKEISEKFINSEAKWVLRKGLVNHSFTNNKLAPDGMKISNHDSIFGIVATASLQTLHSGANYLSHWNSKILQKFILFPNF